MNTASKKMTTFSERYSLPGWKKILISLACMVALCAVVYFFGIPNPNMILITGLVVVTSILGSWSGVVSAAVMIVYSMFFFSTDHSFIIFSSVNLQKLIVIILGTLITVTFVGRLKKANDEVVEELKEVNAILSENNRLLEAASMQDALTGLRNRFALRQAFPGYTKKPLNVMMLDIDSFKEINDDLGHEAGDEALVSVSSILIELFGKEDSYRYGGDEFLVIRDGMTNEAFQELARELKRRMGNLRLGEASLPILFSAGCVYGTAEHSNDLRLMIRHADNRLYEAKNQGKNQIVMARFHRTFAEQLTVPIQRDTGFQSHS